MRINLRLRTSDRAKRRGEVRRRYHPEVAIGGFTHLDTTVEFYTRVNSLLRSGMVAVDLGAGRGRWYTDDDSPTRRELQTIRGKVDWLIGIDVDPVVASNPALDEHKLIGPDGRLPMPDASVDIVVSDWTFEHICEPAAFSSEVLRIVRPGGWVCARTPNKWGYIGAAARTVPNSWHVSWLKHLQPHRVDRDVFPVVYKLNTPKSIAESFSDSYWSRTIYTLASEPAYAGESVALWRLFLVIQRLEPASLRPVLAVFMRKTE